MSGSVKKSLQLELVDNTVELSSEEYRAREMEDEFILVECMHDTMQDNDQYESNSTDFTSDPQYVIHGDICDDPVSQYCSTDVSKELVVEQHYWEQQESVVKKVNKPKYVGSHRMKLKELWNIAHRKSICRQPSYYQFDKSTTEILEMLTHKHVGPYYNVVGTGQDSVVVYAHCPLSAWTYFIHGHAVKVYKLTSDVNKNSVILNRAQREYDHLKLLKYLCYGHVPCVVHKYRNVTVMGFIGYDQETAPSITSLPSKHSQEMYDIVVKQIHMWYNKLHVVHGRLSSKNILYWRGFDRECQMARPNFVGWSHSVRNEHPKALKKLMRDCHFVTKFFERRNVAVKSTEELFKSITGHDKLGRKLLDLIHDKGQWQNQQQCNPNRTERDCHRLHRTRFK